MKRTNRKRAAALAAVLLMSIMTAVPVSAETDASDTVATITESDIAAEAEETGETDISESDVSDETMDTSETVESTEDVTSAVEEENKYYTDDFYDTEGNATLIKKEKVIYDSEEMQFIAVTTKDGSVFYVLINYSAAGDEDNVYFLNKVDDLDLYALLYSGDDEEGNNSPEAAKAAADKMLRAKETEAETEIDTTEAVEPDTAPAQQTGSSNSNFMMILLVGVIVLVAIGFVCYKFIFSKQKKKSDADLDSFDEGDELEIDEDEEK